MLKRLFVGICILLVVCLVLISCSGGDNASGNAGGGAYTPLKELKITIWYTQGTDYVRPPVLTDNVVSDWVYDKTKVTIENIYGNDGGQWDTKLYRLIAGDNLPEIIACSSGQGPAHFSKLAEADKVWELNTELLKKYAPNVLKRIPEDMLERFKVDGKLYGIPFGFNSSEKTQPNMTPEEIAEVRKYSVAIPNDETHALWIRDDIAKMLYPDAKDWAEICALIEEKQQPIGDELFDIPINSKEDYIKLMYDIKSLNLVSEGKPVYAFGYDGGDNWTGLNYLGGDMLGYATHYYTSSWNPETKEIRLPLLEPIVREAARIQNRFINDNVIDPESLVHTNTMFKEKVLNGQYAISGLGSAGGIRSINDQLENAGKPFRYRPLYSSVKNLKEYHAGKQPEVWISSIAFLKTLNENELIQILHWMNTLFSDEYEEIYWWGPKEAGLYIETQEGGRRYIDDRFNQRFIKGDTLALPIEDSMGLGNTMRIGLFYPNAVNSDQSRWNPVVFNKRYSLTPYNYNTKALLFPEDSIHSTILEPFPPCEAWSPEFADIPEVVKYWGNREQWEQPFKIALSAKSEQEFEIKWDEAIETLNKIVDTGEMCRKMTEIARAQYEIIMQSQ
jgi:putative aldouronate transport system substrate-binding protein